MQDMVLTKKRILAGVWEGVLVCADPDAKPELELWHLDEKINALAIAPDTESRGRFNVAITIPIELLTDGVQTFIVRNAATGQKLGNFSIVTGEPLEDDIRADVDLLRAELDMLKKAFRRHCVETA